MHQKWAKQFNSAVCGLPGLWFLMQVKDIHALATDIAIEIVYSKYKTSNHEMKLIQDFVRNWLLTGTKKTIQKCCHSTFWIA